MADLPDTLQDITRELIALRKKPTTQERFKQYPALLQRFKELIAVCDDPAVLKEVIALDSGYHLLAGYRQNTLERLLELERTPSILRAYAMQLRLFGDVDEFGEADTEIDAKADALDAEANALENAAL